MPDKKLTDNEIIKALESCGNHLDCVDCECVDNCPQDINELNELTFDLINRLQAENERLSKIIRPLIAEIKAEAYTECIAKVKEKSQKTEIVCSGALVTTDYAISNKNLDKLLKELVGEDK